MSDTKYSKMEMATINALDSANPFNTPMSPTISKGRRVDKLDKKQDKPVVPEKKIEVENVPIPEPVKKAMAEAKPVEIKERPTVELPAGENPIAESRSEDGMPSYRCEFGGRDVFVGWPWYKTTNPVTAAVNVAMALDFGRDKIRFDMVIGDSMIANSRNKIVEAFLATDAKWLLMIDDDMIPSIGRPNWMKNWVPAAKNIHDTALSRHVIHKLIGAGKTIVGCAYFGRREDAPLICSDQSLVRDARAYADRVVPVDWVGTGCILIHRSVFNDIREVYPELGPENPGDGFDYFRSMGHGIGEDIAFCKRAKKAGHQPHVDLSVPTFHVGYKTY
jgi:hypothetical protein